MAFFRLTSLLPIAYACILRNFAYLGPAYNSSMLLLASTSGVALLARLLPWFYSPFASSFLHFTFFTFI